MCTLLCAEFYQPLSRRQNADGSRAAHVIVAQGVTPAAWKGFRVGAD